MGLMGNLSGDPAMSTTGTALLERGADVRDLLGGGKDGEGGWKFKTDPVLGGGIWVNETTGEAMYADLPGAPRGYNPVTGGMPTDSALPKSRGVAPVPGAPEAPPGYNEREIGKASGTEKHVTSMMQGLANNILEIKQLTDEDPEAGQPGMLEGLARSMGLDAAAAKIGGEKRQKVERAYNELLDKVLWLVTGAAYNEQQLEQNRKAYVPTWYDDPATVEAKRRGLMSFIQDQIPRSGRAVSPEVADILQQAINAMYGSAPVQEEEPQPAPVVDDYGGFRVIGVE
jgi:hypothetical protein